MAGPDDIVDDLLRKAADATNWVGAQLGQSKAHSDAVLANLHSLHQTTNHVTHFVLLPLCVVLYCFHEHYHAMADSKGFPIGRVITRTLAFVALILGYGYLCRLITTVAGAGGHWMSFDRPGELTGLDGSMSALGDYWKNLGENGWSGLVNGGAAIWKYCYMLVIWMMVVSAALFAFIATSLLSFLQSVFLAFLLSLGKLAITVSIVPGVSVAKGWAKSLAQVAAWSTVAGVMGGMLHGYDADIRSLIAHGEILALLRVAAHYVVVAVMTLAVPLLTSKVFSGAAPGISEAALGFMAVIGVAGKAAAAGAGGVAKAGAQVAGGVAGAARPGMHKAPYQPSAPAGNAPPAERSMPIAATRAPAPATEKEFHPTPKSPSAPHDGSHSKPTLKAVRMPRPAAGRSPKASQMTARAPAADPAVDESPTTPTRTVDLS